MFTDVRCQTAKPVAASDRLSIRIRMGCPMSLPDTDRVFVYRNRRKVRVAVVRTVYTAYSKDTFYVPNQTPVVTVKLSAR